MNLHARVSLNTVSAYNWTLAQDIAFCAATGIEAVTVPMYKLRDSTQAGIAELEKAGLRCVALAAGGGSLIESASKTLENLKPAIEIAGALKCPFCYIVTGPTPPQMPTDDAYDRLIASLGSANDYARSLGVRLGIEPNSVSTRQHGFIHTLADAVDLSRATDIGICVELQNCWYERNLDRLFRENVERFGIVQVSDFLVGESVQFNRRVPGDGSMPVEWMLGRLLEAGYGGFFDLEVLGPSIEAEGYDTAIRRGLEWLSERLRSWNV